MEEHIYALLAHLNELFESVERPRSCLGTEVDDSGKIHPKFSQMFTQEVTTLEQVLHDFLVASLTAEQRKALIDYASEHTVQKRAWVMGPRTSEHNWKEWLLADWMRAGEGTHYTGPWHYLQQIRNDFGSGTKSRLVRLLERISISELKDIQLKAEQAVPYCVSCGSLRVGFDAWVSATGEVIGGPYDECMCLACETNNICHPTKGG